MSIQSEPREFTRGAFVMAILEHVFALNWGADASAELVVDVLQTLDNFTFKEEEGEKKEAE
jgi:hypothetical protein